jgi:hypothetical protein
MTARPGKSPEPKSRFKQIGFPHFNTGRETLPVKSGADKLRQLRLLKFCKMTARLGKRPESKSRFKQIGFPPFNTGRENLPVKSGAGRRR